MIGDPLLNDFALGILLFVVVVLSYGIIAIHDIPHFQGAKPSAAGCNSCRRVGEPLYAACALTVSLDLDHGIPARPFCLLHQTEE